MKRTTRAKEQPTAPRSEPKLTLQQVETGSPGDFDRMTDEELVRSILVQTKELAELDPEFANEVMLLKGKDTTEHP